MTHSTLVQQVPGSNHKHGGLRCVRLCEDVSLKRINSPHLVSLWKRHFRVYLTSRSRKLLFRVARPITVHVIRGLTRDGMLFFNFPVILYRLLGIIRGFLEAGRDRFGVGILTHIFPYEPLILIEVPSLRVI